VSPEQHWPLHGAELFIAVCGYAVRVTAGTGRRPTGPETKPIERSASAPTVVELLASFAFPFIVITIARSNWVLPSIALTIGPLLLWIDHLVHIPSFRPGGLGLDRRPLVLVAVRSGSALAATIGLAAGILLFGTATAGFHDPAGRRPQDWRRSSIASSPHPS
jgi:hypothetical protein